MRYIENRENSRRGLGNYISDFFENGYRSVKGGLVKAACTAAVTGVLLAPGCASTRQRDWREIEQRPAGEITVREPGTFDRYFNWPAKQGARGIDRVAGTELEEWLDRQHPLVRSIIGGIADGLITYGLSEFYDKNFRSHTGKGPRPVIGPTRRTGPDGTGDVGDPPITPVGPSRGTGDVGD